MKKTTSIFPLLTLAALGLISREALGQDYFRTLNTPAQLQAVQPPSAQEEDRYNMALGPVRFNVAAGLGVQYNDNIELAHSDKKSDFVLLPSANIEAAWRISDLNTLRFSLGMSYAKYLSHSEFDSRSVLLSPTSALEFTMQVNTVRLTFKDQFSYQEDPYDLPVDNPAGSGGIYRHFENTFSVQADWDMNQYIELTAGYSHYNLWTFDHDFNSLERSVDTVYLRPGVKVTPTVKIGVNGSVSWINFKENIQNDGVSTLVGPFADVQITDATHLYVEGGAQIINFDNNGTIADTSDASSWYFRSELTNRLSDYFSHRLAFSKTTEVGFGTNSYDLYHVEYGAVWNVLPSVSILPSVFYEHYETSGDQSEEANRYGASLGVRYILTPSVTLSADYRFLLKDSNMADADYKQNLVLLSLYYNF